MVRVFQILLLLVLIPVSGWTQSRTVDPDDLQLTVTLEALEATPYQQEMILLTIHGVYKRHITLEKLEQPDLKGINWMQMGQDHWYESTLGGLTVKNMRRRMALFPDETGTLEIGPFIHHLTLLDENNNWFEHDIRSEPVSLTVQAAPQSDDWWFPVRRLQIADDWSNAPDQLNPGEGVLRVIRVSALGVGPDMIPPMPELTSPSALIFPHPEKRLVDLTAQGPEAVAFWRWTITPTNGTSAMLEPVEVTYFDTVARETRVVKISAQRVAFAQKETLPGAEPPSPHPAHPLWLLLALGSSTVAALAVLLRQRQLSLDGIKAWAHRQSLLRALRQGARRDDLAALRRASHALDRLCPPDAGRKALLAALDQRIYAKAAEPFDPLRFSRQLRERL